MVYWGDFILPNIAKEDILKKTFLLIDTMNLLWRAAHVTRGDSYDRVGLSLHIVLNSLLYTHMKFSVDHVVFCFEGRPWRKDYDSAYKENRKVKEATATVAEREFKEYLMTAQQDLQEFLDTKTNVTVLQNSVLEADDLIAGWIQNHQEDDHIIVSSDSDFQQLIASNVMIYNGVDKKILKHDGVYDEHMKPFKKDGVHVKMDNPEYFLFEKIIRGDTSDNIKPAYPGARKKGTKNKIGIEEAFADRNSQGYAWNNFMNSVWTDENGVDHLVKNKYEHNKLLIDLSAQPDDIKDDIVNTIVRVYENPKKKSQIGFPFVKFCSKYELTKLAEQSERIVTILAKAIKD